VARRWGWLVLATVGALFFLASAIGGAWALGLALRDGDVARALLGAGPVVLTLVFWRWITLGAWLRANPPLDPDTGKPIARAEPAGPWGVVGRILLVLIVAGFTGALVWGPTVDRRTTNAAEGVRSQAERSVRADGTTVADVDRIDTARTIWANGAGTVAAGPDPFDELAQVPGAELVDLSVQDGQAALLFEPDDNPPCVVVTIDGDDLVRSRLTATCP